jgi:phosphoribosyl-AMP cyclohydrolase
MIDSIKWNADGLVNVIAQDAQTKRVLMQAWMNAESLQQTLDSGYAVYWSRSRQKLWAKGEESGNQQKVVEMYLDCDGDVLLLVIEQIGGIACHTGRESCFYRRWVDGAWQVVDEVKKSPEEMYGTAR